MDLIGTLLKEKGPDLVSALTQQTALSQPEAERFVPAAAKETVRTLQEGQGLDLEGLLGGGNVSSLLTQIDVGALAGAAGLDASKVGPALQTFVPVLLGMLQSKGGGAAGVLSLLGGGDAGGLLGGATKLAGKLFND